MYCSLRYTGITMKESTTIRLDPRLKKAIDTIAKKHGTTLSQIVQLALQAIANEDLYVVMGVSTYPQSYMDALKAESRETLKQFKAGKLKTFSSAKALFDDVLKR
jgi:antitoxin component of RelBE/YafQ-DinJ toxin-antitoxin module